MLPRLPDCSSTVKPQKMDALQRFDFRFKINNEVRNYSPLGIMAALVFPNRFHAAQTAKRGEQMRDFHHAARFNPVGKSVTTIFASSPRIVQHHSDQPLNSAAPLIL